MTKYNVINIILYIIPLLLGAVVSNLCTPLLYQTIPSDFSRTKLILNTLNNSSHKPKIVLFGNSILMNSIDATMLTKAHDNKAYNFGSTGQKLTESLLFYPLLPKSVTTVVQFVSVNELLNSSTTELTPSILINFKLYGYKLNDEAIGLIQNQSLETLSKSSFEINWESRTILKNFINKQARTFLRNDLNLDALSSELYYPFTYRKKVEPNAYKMLIESTNPKAPIDSFEIDVKVLNQLKAAANFLHDRNIKYYVLIPPLNPDLINYTNNFKKSSKLKLVKLNIKNLYFINFVDFLGPEEFIDHVHPAPEGAKRLTIALSKKI